MGMEPYDTHRAYKLTAGARFIRGFRRIGAIAAALILLFGFGLTFIEVSTTIDYDKRYRAQAKCILDKAWSGSRLTMNSLRPDEVQLEESGCAGPGYSDTMAIIKNRANLPPSSIASEIHKVLAGALFSVVAALIGFLTFALLGWICAGFTKD